MCRRATLDLPVATTAPREARRFLTDVCDRWGMPGIRDDLLLAVSELVTNSVLHARTPVTLVVSVATGVVEIGVRDRDPSPPIVRDTRENLLADLDALGSRPHIDDHDPRSPELAVGPAGSVTAGRGLHLLEAIADRWGVTPFADERGSGKEVWFTLALPSGWDPGAECPCQDDPAAVPTAGGARVVARHDRS